MSYNKRVVNTIQSDHPLNFIQGGLLDAGVTKEFTY